MNDSTYILFSGAVISVERTSRQDLQVKGSGLLTNSFHKIDEYGMISIGRWHAASSNGGHYHEVLVMKYH